MGLLYDIAILGGGPAGLSAAINARVRNKTVLVLSGRKTRSALYLAKEVPNYPGVPNVTGPALFQTMQDQAMELGAEFLPKRVISAVQTSGGWYLGAEDEMLQARTLILCGGVVRNDKFEGEDTFLGRGVSYCATCDGMLYRKKRVVVYGETEESEREANYLKEIGCIVLYLSRRPLQGQLEETIPSMCVKKVQVCGENTVTHLVVDGEPIACDGVFLLRASVAPMDLLPKLKMDANHIKVNSAMETNLPCVYAAGDCIGRPYQIAKAVGEGQIAALSAVSWLDRQEKGTDKN